MAENLNRKRKVLTRSAFFKNHFEFQFFITHFPRILCASKKEGRENLSTPRTKTLSGTWIETGDWISNQQCHGDEIEFSLTPGGFFDSQVTAFQRVSDWRFVDEISAIIRSICFFVYQTMPQILQPLINVKWFGWQSNPISGLVRFKLGKLLSV